MGLFFNFNSITINSRFFLLATNFAHFETNEKKVLGSSWKLAYMYKKSRNMFWKFWPFLATFQEKVILVFWLQNAKKSSQESAVSVSGSIYCPLKDRVTFGKIKSKNFFSTPPFRTFKCIPRSAQAVLFQINVAPIKGLRYSKKTQKFLFMSKWRKVALKFFFQPILNQIASFRPPADCQALA